MLIIHANQVMSALSISVSMIWLDWVTNMSTTIVIVAEEMLNPGGKGDTPSNLM